MVLSSLGRWLFFTLFEFSLSDSFFSYFLVAVSLLSLYVCFQKSGIKGWQAFIPFYRYYRLGQIADREREGQIAAILAGCISLLTLVNSFLSQSSDEGLYIPDLFVAFLLLIFSLILLLYVIRIFLGLCENYKISKWWILLQVIFTNSLPLLIPVLFPKCRPQWTVQELQKESANYFSGSRAAVLDQGLTVNLEERTAADLFKKKYLLRDIHMYIKPGHMVLLLGGSGAGKTTFLNAVNGYEKAKAEVILNGKNMYKSYKEMMFDIGFVPQSDLMRGSDTVYRTLIDAAKMRLPVMLSSADRKARVEEVMEIFGLTPVQNNLVDKLSGGQRKRLSIALEFISNPTLFILDEPDSGLDGVMARELFQQLRLIANQGKIIIVITHTPDRVIDLFDDVIVLAKDSNRTGRLAYFGPVPEARSFFGKEKMEEIVKSINRTEEGGDGRADEFIMKFAEVQHA